MSKRQFLDLSLYLVTDGRVVGNRSLIGAVESAVRGGVTVVQYRDKTASTREMVETAKELASLCHRWNIIFLINDRLDVALAVDADGVHVGQDDMPVTLARRLLGPDRILGVTVHNEQEIRAAEEQDIDYLSLAPVFATATKPDHQAPLGIDGLKPLVAVCNRPVVAIGGIQIENAAGVMATGLSGICVVSAILASPEPEYAAARLRKEIEKGRAS